VRAWNAALELIAAQPRGTRTIQLGDFPDNEAFGRHGKTFGRKLDPEKHLKIVNQEAAKLRAASSEKLTYLEGNHCSWIQRYVAGNAPMAESTLLPLGQILGMPEPEPYQKLYFIGKVAFCHDQGYAGAGATRQTMDAVNRCVVHGHDHRSTLVFGGDVEGRRIFGLGCGWLGDVKHISYAPPARTRQWQLSIGVLDYADGIAFPRLVPFVKGRFALDGRTYR
jgi:hypothetical protein